MNYIIVLKILDVIFSIYFVARSFALTGVKKSLTLSFFHLVITVANFEQCMQHYIHLFLYLITTPLLINCILSFQFSY